MAKIAILGYGTVGSGVAHVLDENADRVRLSAGEDVTLAAILDLREFPGDPHEELVTHDYQTILDDPEITVVCETMGGVKPAYEFTKKALEAGKSVCTSNKELVAKHGCELCDIAKQHGVSYLFEASVGGGIPILRTLEGALKSEKIDRIEGILNGTTNFILTAMEEKGASFDEVLKKAQEMGYAERDPSADIDGHDARRKIAILGSLMTGSLVDADEVPTQGITDITADDLALANELGGTIKLIGSCRLGENDALEIMVAPFFVPAEHPLASVKGVFNAVAVHGNMLGTSMYYGQGAGKDATASAVVADVCEMVRNAGQTVPTSLCGQPAKTTSSAETARRFFIRFKSGNRDEILAALGNAGDAAERGGEAAVLTGCMKESGFIDKIAGLRGVMKWLRVLDTEEE